MADTFNDDGIRERHGCACVDQRDNSRCQITFHEVQEYVVIDSNYAPRALTQWQARYLAAKLYRLARRIRQRER